MSRITKEQEQIVKENFKEYIKQYGHLYPEEVKDFIVNNFFNESFEVDFYPDVMHQVYATTGAYDYCENFYDMCIKEISKTYSLDQHILDVGCGFYPGFAERVGKLQHDGSITAMDYDLITTEHGNVKLIKSTFTENTDLTNFDLVLGIMPCEATIPMIKASNKQDKDLFIQLCGCTHFENINPYIPVSLEMWYLYLEHILEKTTSKDRIFEMYRPEWAQYPIIKTKKK